MTKSDGEAVEVGGCAMEQTKVTKLFAKAKEACSLSYAPFSKQKCGACLFAVPQKDRMICDSVNSVRAVDRDGDGNSEGGNSSNSSSSSSEFFFTGCRVENAAFPVTVCAVQAAVFHAASAGIREGDIKGIAIVEEGVSRCRPCGVCREVIADFGEIPVYTDILDREPQMSLPRNPPTSYFMPHDDKMTQVVSLIPNAPPLISKALPPDCFVNPLSHAQVLELANAALEASRYAFVTLCNFPVGAALMNDKGEIVTGSNGMASCLSVAMCAEVCAITKAVSSGFVGAIGPDARGPDRNEAVKNLHNSAKPLETKHTGIRAIAVVCPLAQGEFARPCGACRQVLTEFGLFPVYCIKQTGDNTFSYDLAYSDDLLPASFQL